MYEHTQQYQRSYPFKKGYETIKDVTKFRSCLLPDWLEFIEERQK